MSGTMSAVTYRVCHTCELDEGEKREILTLLGTVYGGDFSPEDWDHACGGLHTLALADSQRAGSQIIGHTSLVQRQLLLDGVPLRVGYVEAMGVHPTWQRRGIGRALMAHLHRQLRGAYPLGVLSASDEGLPLYLSCGWQVWRGPLASFTPSGVQPTPEEAGGILVYAPDGQHVNLAAELTCDYRSGDVW